MVAQPGHDLLRSPRHGLSGELPGEEGGGRLAEAPEPLLALDALDPRRRLAGPEAGDVVGAHDGPERQLDVGRGPEEVGHPLEVGVHVRAQGRAAGLEGQRVHLERLALADDPADGAEGPGHQVDQHVPERGHDGAAQAKPWRAELALDGQGELHVAARVRHHRHDEVERQTDLAIGLDRRGVALDAESPEVDGVLGLEPLPHDPVVEAGGQRATLQEPVEEATEDGIRARQRELAQLALELQEERVSRRRDLSPEVQRAAGADHRLHRHRGPGIPGGVEADEG